MATSGGDQLHLTKYSQHLVNMIVVRARREYLGRYTKPYQKTALPCTELIIGDYLWFMRMIIL